jgi:hypothetical protein
VTEDEYSILLQQMYEFCWRVAAGSGKSSEPIIRHEPPLLKHCSDAMANFKNLKRVDLS